MELNNTGDGGASLSDFQAIELAVDGLQSRIGKMDVEIKRQQGTIEHQQCTIASLEYDKRNLAHQLAEMEQRLRSAKQEARSEVRDELQEETEAKYARKLYVLEQANAELDAETDIIASERDILQNKVIELETTCQDQKVAIEHLSVNVPIAPTHTGFRCAVSSLKAKLGLDKTRYQD